MKQGMLKLVAVFGLVLGFVAMPAKADTQFAIGVAGNIADFTTTGTEEEGFGQGRAGNPIETIAGSASREFDYPSIFVEMVGRNTWGGMTLGLEYVPGDASIGAKSRTDSKGDQSESESDVGTYTGKAEISDFYQLYLEPTIYVSDSFGVYLKGGVNHITVTSLETLQSGGAYGNVDVWGGTVGAGLRYKHSSGFLVKTEFSRTKYEGVTLVSNTGNKNRIKADPESDNLKLAIGYQF